MSIGMIDTNTNVFSIDLSQATTAPGISLGNVSGDTYQVNLPGIPPAGSVTITSGASEVTSTLGSTVLGCTVSNTKSALVNKSTGQAIDVLLTRSAVTYTIQFTGILNVYGQSNP